jgi:DNA polymerase delta subunit 3
LPYLFTDHAYSELATYHASTAPSFATYLITGEVPPPSRRYGDEMDVDDEEYDEEEDEADIPETKIVLVPEHELECECPLMHALQISLIPFNHLASKSQFTHIFSTYVYALSPSPIRVSLV